MSMLLYHRLRDTCAYILVYFFFLFRLFQVRACVCAYRLLRHCCATVAVNTRNWLVDSRAICPKLYRSEFRAKKRGCTNRHNPAVGFTRATRGNYWNVRSVYSRTINNCLIVSWTDRSPAQIAGGMRTAICYVGMAENTDLLTIYGHRGGNLLKIQGHPTEYFGKISVRMEGRLRISKFFPSDALDFSNFFGKP